MHYSLLATDYDNTLAHQGQVSATTIAALDRWKAAGGKLILITGRHLVDLRSVFQAFDRFDLMVLENGALLYHPQNSSDRLLGESAPQRLVQAMEDASLAPIYRGKSLIATSARHQATIESLLKDLGISRQIILNKEDMMVLPHGVNKASGLRTALMLLEVDAAQTVAVGDAQNDIDLLEAAGYGVAVANALPELKAVADHVTQAERGAGVVELIDSLLTDAATEG